MSKRFTNSQLKALKPLKKRYIRFEGGGKGFGIRVEPTGRKTFFFEYRFQGRNRVFTIGPFPKVGLNQARSQASQLKHQVENGIDPGLEKKTKQATDRNAFTVRDLVEEYLEKWAKPNKKEKSYKEDLRLLNKDVLPSWGRRKAKDIIRRDIVLLLDEIVDRGANVTANRTLAVIRKMFNFAVSRDILDASPCAAIASPTKEKSRERVLSETEIKSFWSGLDNASMVPGMKLLLKFLLITAQRKGEVLEAEWNEFDLDKHWWEIPAEKTKTKNIHRVPLSPLAIKILKEAKQYSNGSRWIFPSPVGSTKNEPDRKPWTFPFTGPAVDHAVRDNMKIFAINHFTPHDLRRTAASMMTKSGIERLTVKKLLNHSDKETTAIYDRYGYDKEKRKATTNWHRRLEKILGEE